MGRLPVHGADRDQIGGYPDPAAERAEAVPLWEPASPTRHGDPAVRAQSLPLDDWLTPRFNTYPGREVPNPITVDIVKGGADIRQVLKDLMALTKLNFNNAGFSDGLPVTLRFADLTGEILTAGPTGVSAPLPFRFYI